MIRALLSLLVWLLLSLALPLAGAVLGQIPLADLFEIPLRERAWDALSLSPALYWGTLALTTAGLALLLLRRPPPRPRRAPTADNGRGSLRYWAWLGTAALILAPTLGLGQSPHAGEALLWLGALLLLDAHTQAGSGHSLIQDRPLYLLSLFPAGVLLDALLQYLNLFLQNWTYPRTDLSPAQWVFWQGLHAGLLLPLLLVLRQWLAQRPTLLRLFHDGPATGFRGDPELGWILVLPACLGLAGAALWPDWIYPLTWFAPLLLAQGMALIRGRTTLFTGLHHGNWSRPLLTALAAIAIALAAQAWDQAFGPQRAFTLPLLQGPGILGLPLPGYLGAVAFGLTGLWLADQAGLPWRRGKEAKAPRFPVQIRIG